MLRGGTKINVTYSGNCPSYLKEAFKNACEIWEETLPTTLPWKIHVSVDSLGMINGQSISKVSIYRGKFLDEDIYCCPAQVKYGLFAEYARFRTNSTYIDSLSTDFFNDYDATIVYNPNYINNLDIMSFSLNDTPTSKYDFITIALRDLAKVLGFFWTIPGNNNAHRLNISTTQNPVTYTPFEKIIDHALNSNGNVYTAYTNATQGYLDSPCGQETYRLYAPNPWKTKESLNYFIPDSTKKLTRLLTYDFGKGTVVRDIYDDYSFVFKTLLSWEYNEGIAVGNTGGGDYETWPSSHNNTININGTVRALFGNNTNEVYQPSLTMSRTQMTERTNNSSIIWNHIAPYYPGISMSGNTSDALWTVALQTKDGSWDVVYQEDAICPVEDFYVDVTSFVRHYSDDEYYRNCDGYMKCRLSRYKYTGNSTFDGNTVYFFLKCIPQKVKMSPAKVDLSGYEDEYYREIIIPINDFEGVNSLLVEQKEEGEDVPFSFPVSDFGNAYYTAIVDKELDTEFTVIAYNANGTSRSATYTFEALEPWYNNLSVEIRNGRLFLKTKSGRHMNLIRSYSITPVNSFINQPIVKVQKNANMDSNGIDVHNLKKGMYVLKLEDVKGRIHDVKFIK